MAKKQTFTDKLKRGATTDKFVHVIAPFGSDEKNSIKFAEKNVRIPEGGNEDQLIDAAIKDMQTS